MSLTKEEQLALDYHAVLEDGVKNNTSVKLLPEEYEQFSKDCSSFAMSYLSFRVHKLLPAIPEERLASYLNAIQYLSTVNIEEDGSVIVPAEYAHILYEYIVEFTSKLYYASVLLDPVTAINMSADFNKRLDEHYNGGADL